jgi:Uma2 family endonuclease
MATYPRHKPAWTRAEYDELIALERDSEPEPDLSVVAGDPRDSSLSHPARPVLIVEVAETSLTFDREHKGSLYARAGIMDYWIINLVDRELEIHRDPVAAPLAPFGWQYRPRQAITTNGTISALAAPSAGISVADLMP